MPDPSTGAQLSIRPLRQAAGRFPFCGECREDTQNWSITDKLSVDRYSIDIGRSYLMPYAPACMMDSGRSNSQSHLETVEKGPAKYALTVFHYAIFLDGLGKFLNLIFKS
jgi:hypothetical protein